MGFGRSRWASPRVGSFCGRGLFLWGYFPGLMFLGGISTGVVFLFSGKGIPVSACPQCNFLGDGLCGGG